jgi:hypothetical protein
MTTDQTDGRCAARTRKNKKTGKCEPYTPTRKNVLNEPYGGKIVYQQKLQDIITKIKTAILGHSIIMNGFITQLDYDRPEMYVMISEYQRKRAHEYWNGLRKIREKASFKSINSKSKSTITYLKLLEQICKGTVEHPDDQMGVNNKLLLQKQVPKFAYDYYDYYELLDVLQSASYNQLQFYPQINPRIKVIFDNFDDNTVDRILRITE